jgi:hypothetical protein
MGLFNRKPTAATDALSREQETDSVSLADPGRPEGDLTQTGYKLFDACGLSYVAYGSGTLAELFEQVKVAAPVFADSIATPSGLGSFRGKDDSMWVGYEGPAGAVLALHCFPDADGMFLITAVMDPLRRLPAPWRLGIATIKAEVPRPVARILQTAYARPAWDLPGIATPESQMPALTVSPSLRRELEEAGWQPLDGDLFKAMVTTIGERSQLVYLSPWSSTEFAVMSPIASSPDGAIPAGLRELTFGDYALDVIADMVVLVDTMPAGSRPPTAEEFSDRAITLAAYADRTEADLSPEDRY